VRHTNVSTGQVIALIKPRNSLSQLPIKKKEIVYHSSILHGIEHKNKNILKHSLLKQKSSEYPPSFESQAI